MNEYLTNAALIALLALPLYLYVEFVDRRKKKTEALKLTALKAQQDATTAHEQLARREMAVQVAEEVGKQLAEARAEIALRPVGSHSANGSHDRHLTPTHHDNP